MGKSTNLPETVDEDGFPCEDIEALTNWIVYRLAEMQSLKEYFLKAINFSTYGASFVYVDESGKVLTPCIIILKNILKHSKRSFMENIKEKKSLL